MRTLRLTCSVAALCACVESDTSTDPLVPDGDAKRGKLLVAAYGCGSCHIIPEVNGADGVVGPPLSDWTARQWIAGNLRNEPANLTAWLENPQVIEPGTAMPAQGVTPQDARDMAAFLYTLRPSALGPPHPLPLRWLEALGYERRSAPLAGAPPVDR